MHQDFTLQRSLVGSMHARFAACDICNTHSRNPPDNARASHGSTFVLQKELASLRTISIRSHTGWVPTLAITGALAIGALVDDPQEVLLQLQLPGLKFLEVSCSEVPLTT